MEAGQAAAAVVAMPTRWSRWAWVRKRWRFSDEAGVHMSTANGRLRGRSIGIFAAAADPPPAPTDWRRPPKSQFFAENGGRRREFCLAGGKATFLIFRTLKPPSFPSFSVIILQDKFMSCRPKKKKIPEETNTNASLANYPGTNLCIKTQICFFFTKKNQRPQVDISSDDDQTRPSFFFF